MKVTAYHILDNLSGGLYENSGNCLTELVRNSAVASMINNVWEPKRVRIEISLVPNHPLVGRGENALVIFDRGCGLTEPAIERYFSWLGTPISHLNGASERNGASQKGIGRLAALALNKKCLEGDIAERIKHGYYLFSRTAKNGDVRFVTVIPERVETQGGIETDRFISPTSTEMGPLKNLAGSFTMIVIPTPVFGSHNEIYDALKWYLPREEDKMYELQVGGKLVRPPPLQEHLNISSVNGEYRARLGVGTTESDGVWLCDNETGLRVASCGQLGRLLPAPLWYPDLVGDIFAPKLLRHQNTARSTLAREFTKKGNREWQRLLMFLISEVVAPAKKLIEKDVIQGNAAKTLDELVDMFKDRFGPPEEVRDVGPPPPPPPKDRPVKPTIPTVPPTKDLAKDKEKKDKVHRHVSIRVGEETYHLYRGQTLYRYVFAQVSPSNKSVIYVNVRGGYESLPNTQAERREHCLMQILTAIGGSKFRSDPYQAALFANEVRAQILQKK
ncbi:MAG: hypothetical protein A2836_01760 [Candidatus Taylorbacteria bacterium RIFCSPHIGHO2_01_FULL_45_63]|nr:MAG: hypothetical protein A2836_01760 [Candidatus Taylorbacteria bacterium RIFCSPHIGHO2_01_FULL_45_63]OHA32793.1 MAG: hypothetical protein A3A22_02520 [Candidatus Taylorbacteria bacterium RIFCSPLOWO2_01_FULL_45_34b]